VGPEEKRRKTEVKSTGKRGKFPESDNHWKEKLRDVGSTDAGKMGQRKVLGSTSLASVIHPRGERIRDKDRISGQMESEQSPKKKAPPGDEYSSLERG